MKRYQSGVAIGYVLTSLGLVSALSLTTYTMLSQSGEISAETIRIQKTTLSESTVQQAAYILAVEAADTDSDGAVEAPGFEAGSGPTGGGLIPAASMAPKVDASGRSLGYCAWDNGSTQVTTSHLAGVSGSGLNAPSFSVISAGADGVFDTTCADSASGLPSGDDQLVTFNGARVAQGVGGTIYYADPVDTLADLNALDNTGRQDGEVRMVRENSTLYSYDADTDSWSIGTSPWDTDLDQLTFTGGNVGIGTETPGAQLDVLGGGVGATMVVGNSDASASGQIQVRNDANDSAQALSIETTGTASAGGVKSRIMTTGDMPLSIGADGVELITVDSGMVGIGTVSPEAFFHVARGVEGELAKFSLEGLSNNPALSIVMNDAAPRATLVTSSDLGATDIALAPNGVERFFFNEQGMGVGVQNPSYNLELADNQAIRLLGSQPIIQFAPGGTDAGAIQQVGNSLLVNAAPGAAGRNLTLGPNGYVTLGPIGASLPPAERLTVTSGNGPIFIGDQLTGNGDNALFLSGLSGPNNYALRSDGATGALRLNRSAGAMRFEMDGAEQMRLDASGTLTALADIVATDGFVANTGTNLAPGYRFSGRSDTGMYSPGPAQLAFSAGGTPALTLTPDGAVVNGIVSGAQMRAAGFFTGTGSGPSFVPIAGLDEGAGGALRLYAGGSPVAVLNPAGELLLNGSRVWTAANDGSGSGLNADLLDGYSAPFFRDASNLNTGTLAEARLPFRMNQNVRTTDSVSFAGLIAENSAELRHNGSRRLATTANGIDVDGTIQFPEVTAAKLNLWRDLYQIGVQSGTQYFRTGSNFAWYRGGVHDGGQLSSGGGARLMRLMNTGTLYVNEQLVWTEGTDGVGSGLDADLLDGQSSEFFRNASNINAGTLAEARLPFRMNQNVRTTDSVRFGHIETTGTLVIAAGGDSSNPGSLYINAPGNRLYMAPRRADGSGWNWGKEFGFNAANDEWYFEGSPVINGNPILHSGNYATYLDDRYFTEAESDGRFVNAGGDAMAGRLTIAGISASIGGDRARAHLGHLVIGGGGSTLGIDWNEIATNASGGLGILAERVSFAVDNLDGVRVNGNPVWHAANDGALSGLDADQLDGVHLVDIFNSMGETHGTNRDFNTTNGFGWRFIQTAANGPGTPSRFNQYYNLNVGLGTSYPFGTYMMQVAIPRHTDDPYLSVRFQENGTFGAWQKVSAGQADNALLLEGNPASFFRNASNINAGTLAEARLPFRMNQNVRTTDDVRFGGLDVRGRIMIAPSGNPNNAGSIYISTVGDRFYMLPRLADGSNWNFARDFGFDTASNEWYFDSAPLIAGNTTLHAGNYATFLDDRYFTEAESDIRFVNSAGDAMGGRLTINGSIGTIGADYNRVEQAYLVVGGGTDALGLDPNEIASNAAGGLIISARNIRLNVDGANGVTVNGGVVWTSTNDGAGSGLDSDRLDGFDSSYFLNASNLNAGTLAEARLPFRMNQNVRTTDAVTFAQVGIDGVNLDSPTGNYGSIQVNGAGKAGWQGYSIAGRYVFMSSGNNTVGIYDDVENEWVMYGANDGVDLRFAGSPRLSTNAAGVTVSGTVQFPNVLEEKLYLGYNDYEIGVQSNTHYSRTGGNFAWYRGGNHSNTELNAGGGVRLMYLTSAGDLFVNEERVWTQGNDGSGSGLDADLFDGLNSSQFLRSDTSGTLQGDLTVNGAVAINSTLGLTFENGNHRITYNDGRGNFNIRVGTDASEVITEAGYGFHTEWSQSGGSIQWHISQAGAVGEQAVWQTSMILSNGELTINGQRFWNAGNDGSGSGLDADVLDGQDSSFYRNASNINAGVLAEARLPYRMNQHVRTTDTVRFGRLVVGSGAIVTGGNASVLGGQSNEARGNASVVGGGVNNRSFASQSGIFIGSGNTITSAALAALIGGGIDNTIDGGYWNAMLTARGSTLSGNTSTQNNAILAGNNHLLRSTSSGTMLNNVIVGGFNNRIEKLNTAQLEDSAILAGFNNRIFSQMPNSSLATGGHAILGGFNNDIISTVNASVNLNGNSILAGYQNSITDSGGSAILYGRNHTIEGSSFNVAIGGGHSSATAPGVINALVMGTYLRNEFSNSYIFGYGLAGTPLVNEAASDRIFGVGAGNTWILSSFVNGDMRIGGRLFQFSDRRLKRDEQEITPDDGLATVMALAPKRYYWDLNQLPGADRSRQIGFMAQDLEQTLPESVTVNEDGMYSVSYTSIIPVAVAAIQAQQAHIEENTARIDENEVRLNTHEARLDALDDGTRGQSTTRLGRGEVLTGRGVTGISGCQQIIVSQEWLGRLGWPNIVVTATSKLGATNAPVSASDVRADGSITFCATEAGLPVAGQAFFWRAEPEDVTMAASNAMGSGVIADADTANKKVFRVKSFRPNPLF